MLISLVLTEFGSRLSLDSYDKCHLTVFLVSCDSQCSVAFLTVPWVGQRCLIVVFPGHTHLLFCNLLGYIHQ